MNFTTRVNSLTRGFRASFRDQYIRYVHERPSARYRDMQSSLVSMPNFLEHAQRLCNDGIVILASYFKNDSLREMQEDFQRLAEDMELDRDGQLTIGATEVVPKN